MRYLQAIHYVIFIVPKSIADQVCNELVSILVPRWSMKQNPDGSRLIYPGTEYTENINEQYQVSMEACTSD